MSRRVLAAFLAAAPGVLGALLAEASAPGLVGAVLAVACVALLVAPSAAAPAPGARRLADLAAWWGGAGALVASVLLSSPAPSLLASPTPGRRAALALAGLVAAASVALVARPAPRA